MDQDFASLAQALVERIRDFPKDAFDDLSQALDGIERKHDLLFHLTEEDRRAIDQGVAELDAGLGVSSEEVFGKWLTGHDADTAGKDEFADAASRVSYQPLAAPRCRCRCPSRFATWRRSRRSTR